MPWDLGSGVQDDNGAGRLGGGHLVDSRASWGSLCQLPVSRASGLLFYPAEPTAFSRRHLIIAAMQPSWRQFREEQGERCGVEGAWRWCWQQWGGWERKGAVPGEAEAEALGSVGPSREPEKQSICARVWRSASPAREGMS